MVEWEFFQKRRNVDLSVWIVELNIENYEQLKEICASKKVHPPSYATFQAAQAAVVPTVGSLVEREVQKQEEKAPQPKKKRSTRNTRKRTSK